MTPTPSPARRLRPGGRVVPPPAPRALALAMVVLVCLGVVAWLGQPRGSAPGSPPRHQVASLLESVRVVPSRVPVPGYDRECSGTSGCVFGPAWSDSTSAPGAGNGCSTRQDVLTRDLRGAAAPGASCAAGSPPAGSASVGTAPAGSGVLVDPYTGRTVDVATTGTRGIHVDHVYPLSAAWDMGAWDWTPALRAAFANDVDRNLVAVTGSVNTRKSDATPADWMPPDPRRHCFYAARYLTAAVAYDLPVTESDHRALAGAVRRCPGRSR